MIQSAYVHIEESYTTLSDARAHIAALFYTAYDLGPSCAFLGYQRNYQFNVSGVDIDGTDAFWTGQIQGPIYVEGGRMIENGTMASYGQSQVMVFITIHGYLEPAVYPQNPARPTCG